MTFPFKIPQLGEGLVGARVVTLWKGVGERVERDEPLLEIETDKAIMSLESPVEGDIEEWLVKVEDDAEIGSVVCRIRTPHPNGHETVPEAPEPAEDVSPVAIEHSEGPISPSIRNGQISPRERALARAEGISAREIDLLAREEQGRVSREALQAHIGRKNTEVAPGEPFVERKLSPRQARLASHLESAWREVVPAILEIEVSWDAINCEVDEQRAAHKDSDNPLKATPLHVIAWAVARVMRVNPRFCSTWKSGGLLREWRHVNVGFAVALEADELAVAVVSRAETMDFEKFSRATRAAIASSRAGEKSHGEAQLVISDLSKAGILSAIPLVVPPATATLFVGTPYDAPVRTTDDGLKWERRARLVLTCDNRLVNGAGAAAFLRALQEALPQTTKP